ncbi:DUF2484 family protein [Paracoccus fistulariae]|uniref:DUF2484 family protein n=1 Tax=Paracoccus fistulariae TaxID=658446 RepID=A0ABY7SJL8_9RHOB|nr:DUF2484 family protein [Paracoccus fistulariae]MDB6180560.1 DUF2484 family protein [Paracoccus fistulariae]WCR07198.1 DUF2484 family protein [Paracoccus fistulariae]
MTLPHLCSLIGFGGWLLLVILAHWLPAKYRQQAFWGLVAIGVPILGVITLHWGPGAGIASFAAGVCALFTRPLRAVTPTSDQRSESIHP